MNGRFPAATGRLLHEVFFQLILRLDFRKLSSPKITLVSLCVSSQIFFRWAGKLGLKLSRLKSLILFVAPARIRQFFNFSATVCTVLSNLSRFFIPDRSSIVAAKFFSVLYGKYHIPWEVSYTVGSIIYRGKYHIPREVSYTVGSIFIGDILLYADSA